MTPAPTPTPDGSSLPSRHRPSLGNLSKDTTEGDLWDLDDDLDAPMEAEEIRPAPGTTTRDIPSPREREAPDPRPDPEEISSPKPAAGERVRMNVTKPRGLALPSGSTTAQSKPESDFDDLEHWEDLKAEPDIQDLPADPVPAPVVKPAPVSAPEEVQKPVAEEADDEFSPVIRKDAAPVSLRPHLGLSKAERAGMIALAVLLIAGTLAAVMFSIYRLPTEKNSTDAKAFPVIGKHVTITSATTYWREPITEGPTPDTFRRETQLLPVLEIGVSGGPGALRILFRNDEGALVGDAVTRSVRSSTTLKIPATAGFNDIGMHAAYVTGGNKPWTIEVYEAPSEETTGKDFKKLFELNISTVRR